MKGNIFYSLSFQKKKSEYSKSELLPIILNYYYKGKKLRQSTELKVKIKDWNLNKTEGEWVKKGDESFENKNVILQKKLNDFNELLLEIRLSQLEPTIESVKSFLSRNKKVYETKTKKRYTVLLHLDKFRERKNRDVRIRSGTKRTLNSNINKIESFIKDFQNNNGFQYYLDEINSEFQENFLEFLSESGESISTIRKRFSVLRTFYNWCRDSGVIDRNLKLIDLPIEQSRSKVFLNVDEVMKLYRFDEFNFENKSHSNYTSTYYLDENKKGEVSYTNYELYKDILVFGCGCGCRYSDVVNLKVGNLQFPKKDDKHGFLIYNMVKSRVSKEVSVPMNDITTQIFRKYSYNKTKDDFLFPRNTLGNQISSEKINKNIKNITQIIGLNRLIRRPKLNVRGEVVKNTKVMFPLHELITTHCMRRTFIQNGVTQDIPINVLKEMSGHSSLQVIERYFETTKEQMKVGHQFFSLSDEKPFDIQKIRNLKSEYLNDKIKKEDFIDRILKLI